MKITLRAARVNRGLSLKPASKLIGVCERTLWSWEKGKTFPDSKYISKIEEVYEVKYDNINFF